MKPTFLGVGAMKCGTTTVYHYLKRHPEIFVPEQKEIDYFCPYNTKTLEEYEALFPEDFKVRGEYSPNYQFYTEQISELYPNIKLILTVRNPIKKFISSVRHLFTYMPEAKASFDIEREIIARRSAIMKLGFFKHTILEILDQGFDLHIINFDDLVLDQQRVWNELSDFLGVNRYESSYVHQFPSDGYEHVPIELSETQLEMLQNYYEPSNEFLKEEYGITMKL